MNRLLSTVASLALAALPLRARADEPPAKANAHDAGASRARVLEAREQASHWNRAREAEQLDDLLELLPKHERVPPATLELVAERLGPLEQQVNAYPAFLLEVEPIEVLETPLVTTRLDFELRTTCAALAKLPLVDFACHVSHGQDCTTQADREVVAAGLRARASGKTLDEALEGLRTWEDATQPLSAQLERGFDSVLTLVARLSATQDVCKAIETLTFDAAQLDEVRRLRDGGLPRLQKLANFFEAGIPTELVTKLDEARRRANEEKSIAALREATAMIVLIGGAGEPAGGSSGRLIGAAVSQAMEGLGEFLLTRAKEEGINYLRETFVRRLCNSDVRPFVRETCAVLLAIDHTTTLRAIGKRLQRAMEDDLRRLPDVGLVLGSMYDASLAHYATGLRVAIAIVHSASRGRDPLATFGSLHMGGLVDCEATSLEVLGIEECRETLGLLRSASALLYAIDQQKGDEFDGFWVTATLLDWERRGTMMAPHPGGRRFAPTKLAPEIFGALRAPLTELHRSVDAIRTTVTLVQRNLRDGFDPSSSRDMIVAATTTVEAMIMAGRAIRAAFEPKARPGAPVASIPAPPSRSLARVPREAIAHLGISKLRTSEPSLEIGGAPAAATDPGLDRLLSSEQLPALLRVAGAVGDDDWASAAPAAMALIEPYGRRLGEDEWAELVRLVPVIVEISQAQSSADVAATLEAAVPTGGYRSKYRNVMLSINGFVGFHLAGETYRAGRPAQRVVSGSVAMFAPVGIHVAGPVRAGKARPWAMGGMVSVLDLGTITARSLRKERIEQDPSTDGGPPSVQTSTTTVSELPPLDVRQLFSPGLYYTLGIAESPATIGLGLSYNPMLRRETITTTAPTSTRTDELAVLRFGLFVAIDVTMFAFRLQRR